MKSMLPRTLARLAGTAAAAVFFIAMAAPPAPAARPEEDASVRLAGLAHAYAEARGPQRDRIGEEAMEEAAVRLGVLEALLATDPASALRAALPAHVREKLPPEAAAFVESPAEVEGELEVYYEDYEDRAVLRHFLKDEAGRRFSLHFRGEAPELTHGMRVRAGGLFFPGAQAGNGGPTEGALVLSDGQTLEFLYADSATNPTPITADISNAAGEQSTIVFLVNYPERPEETVTTAQMDNLVFGDISDFYLENSDNRLWFSGETRGWFTIAADLGTCNPSQIALAADAAATAAGVNLSDYGRIVYFMRAHPSCTWSGLGTVGGSPSRAWINGSATTHVIGHELGHNLGLFHSHSLKCGSVPYGTSCASYEYGDRFDIMGAPNAGHLNAFQKARLGWLSESGPFTAVTASAGQTYTLAAYEAAGMGLNAIRVPAGTDAATGKPAWFYVEYRQPVGFDSFFTAYPAETAGVIVRRAVEGTPNSSNLLYMQPAVSAALPVGATFQDPFSSAEIKTLWANGVSAGVLVGSASAVCTRAAPQVTVTPDPGPWSAPGTPVAFTVSVKNLDSSECGTSQFALSAAPPAGWAASFSGGGLYLAPGGTATATLTVTSPASAADGYQDIPFTASNATAASPAASDAATYVVSSPAEDLAPVAADDTASVTAGKSVTFNVLANDRDPEGRPLTLVSVAAPSMGTVTWTADGTLTYKAGRKSTGMDTFAYVIRDPAGNRASASVHVAIAAATRTKPSRKW